MQNYLSPGKNALLIRFSKLCVKIIALQIIIESVDGFLGTPHHNTYFEMLSFLFFMIKPPYFFLDMLYGAIIL